MLARNTAAARRPHPPTAGAGAAATVGVADGTGVPSITSQSAKAPTPHVPAEEKLESIQIAQRTLQTKELLAVVKHVTGVPVGHSLQRQHDAPARLGAITSSNRTALVASARTVSSMTSSRSRSRSDILHSHQAPASNTPHGGRPRLATLVSPTAGRVQGERAEPGRL